MRLGLVLFLTVTLVKDYSGATSLLGFVAPVELLLHAPFELSDTRPMCVSFTRVL